MRPAWLHFLPHAITALAVAAVVYMVRESGASSERVKAQLATAEARVRELETAIDSYQAALLKTQRIAQDTAQVREKVRTITKELIREVPVRVPADACPLPGDWRVLHDAAASGEVPGPAAAGRADGAPVPAQEAAATVIDNYGTCRDTAERLRGLQRYVREITNAIH